MNTLLKKINYQTFFLITGVLLSRLGTSLNIPFITLFLYKTAGLSITATGIIVSLSFITYIIGGFIGGYFSDKIGRTILIVASLVSYCIIFLFYGLTIFLSKNILFIATIFALLNALTGIARSFHETIGQALIAEVCDPDNKRLAFHLRYLAANIGAAIGPLIGAIFSLSGTPIGFYFTSLIFFIYLVFFIIIFGTSDFAKNLNPILSLKQTILILYNDNAMRNFVIAGGMLYFGYVQQETLFALIIAINSHNTQLFPLMLSINAILIIALQIPLAYLTRNLPVRILVIVGVFLMISGLIMVGLKNNSIPFYILSEIIFTLGEMLVLPLTGMLIDMLAPAHLRGTYFGAASFQYIGRAFGPIVGSMLLTYYGSNIAMMIIALITACSILFYYRSIGKSS